MPIEVTVEGIHEAAERFYESLKGTGVRLHQSASDSFSVESLRSFKPLEVDMKPRPGSCLWWDVDGDWFRWCCGEQMNWLQEFVYEVILDDSRLLRIKTVKQLEKFEQEYSGEPDFIRKIRAENPGTPLFQRRSKYHIDYPRVAEKYAGLEIAPYLYKKRLDSMWYYGWDCASGCVWDRAAIRALRLFARYDKNKGEYVRVQ